MNKKISALLITIFLCFVQFVACSHFHPQLPSVKREENTVGTLRQQSVNGTLANVAENGYADTKRFLSELAVPDKIISEFSDEELDFFTRSDSIAAFSSDGLENKVNMRQIIAMHTTGRMRLYSDIEWTVLPKKRYTDLITINRIPQIITSYENALITISYNGITKTLTPEKDYRIYIDIQGFVGSEFNLGEALKGVKKVDKNGVKIHFQIDVFNAGPHEYSCFNLELYYHHAHTKHDGITQVGYSGSFTYIITERSRMRLSCYELGPSHPLSFFPEGFQKPE